KKENAATQEPEKQAEKTAMTFYAVPQGGERTGLDGALNSIWTEGDQIKIFTEATIATGGDVFTLSKGAGTDYGEFTGESVEGLEYLGVYPASSFYISTTYIGLEFDMPSTQTYVENSYASNTVPLFAGSESKNLTFENLSGLLRVGIKVTSPTTVTSMVLKDKNSNAKLWGKYVVVLYQISRVSAYLGQGGASLTMDLGDGVALNTSTYTYFFFSVPALTEPGNVQALSSGFTIEMEDADGKTAIIDYTGTDKKVEQGKGKTLEVDDVEFVTPAPTRPACQSALDADANWVTIGSQQWLKVNTRCIEYDTESEAYNASWLTDNTIPTSSDPVYTPYYTPTGSGDPDGYGYYYNWAAAVGVENGQTYGTEPFSGKRQGICPNGSHIPTADEWNALKTFIETTDGKGSNTVGKHLRSNTADWNGTKEHLDTYGFAALPAGFAYGSIVYDVGYYADFWTATSTEGDSYSAYYGGLYYDYDGLNDGGDDKSNGHSVRCLRD
ncbi:MAG: fibrobacter succinogenes major paralogous domain-containing protein, partial [Paludibacteraceae bacterium]|nr:fibrobacter succinogenes major paralogous domain-containing protein [Paludibacteraceae bacterium]